MNTSDMMLYTWKCKGERDREKKRRSYEGVRNRERQIDCDWESVRECVGKCVWGVTERDGQ